MSNIYIFRTTLKRSLAALILFAMMSQSVFGATWYVDTNADNDPDTCVAGEMDADGDCTFRDAVSQAGDNDSILFLNDYTITNTDSSTSPYWITQSGLTVDGEANTVAFDGNAEGGGSSYNYFKITGNTATVQNISAYNYNGNVFYLSFSDGSTINNNNIGVESDGSTESTIDGGVFLSGVSNTTISGNTIGGNGNAILIVGNTVDTSITGNYIGTNAAGDNLSNNWGIYVYASSLDGGDGGVEGLVIGGTDVVDGNYIAYNNNPGIGYDDINGLTGTSTIQNNYIGVAPDGSTSAGNAASALAIRQAGIYVDEDTDNLDLNILDNLIAGNRGDNIKILAGNNVVIQGNNIGFTADGSTAISNTGDGIQVDATNVLIGSDLDGNNDAAEANSIGNAGALGGGGVAINVAGDDSETVTVTGNSIGVYNRDDDDDDMGSVYGGINVAITNANPTNLTVGAPGVTQSTDGQNVIMNNDDDAIYISSLGTGSTTTVANNYVDFNMGDGIEVDLTAGTTDLRIGTDGDGTNDASERNVFTGNSIGINVGAGVTSLIIAGNGIGAGPDDPATDFLSDLNTDESNGAGSISVDGTGFTGPIVIGGDADAERNIISSMMGVGIDIIDAGSTAQNVTIQNNYINIGEDGTTNFAENASDFLIDIAEAAAISLVDNVIAGSSGGGVTISGGTSFTGTGNMIGTDSTGNTAFGVRDYGVYVDASAMTSFVWGGATALLGNVIGAVSGSGYGLYINSLQDSSSTVTVQGSKFGVSADEQSTFTMAGAAFSSLYGDIDFGGDNALGVDGTGDIEEGNVVAGTTGACFSLGGSNVSSASLYGNIFNLVRSVGGAAFDTAAANGSDCIVIDSSALATLNIGRGTDGSTTATSSRNVIAGSTNGSGILLQSFDNDTGTLNMENNYIGLDYAGTSDMGFSQYGVYSTAPNGTLTYNIGGTGVNEGNVISANTYDAIHFDNNATITANIYGNYIGTNAAGTAALANGWSGINIASTAVNVTSNIGNGAAAGRNIISGNLAAGIMVIDGTAVILGNYIGTNAAGTAVLGNGSLDYGAGGEGRAYGGVYIDGGSVTLGGSTAGQENVISGNYGQGVYVGGATALSIIGNYIGTNSSDDDLGNQVAVGTTYDLASGTAEDTALNGSGIVLHDTNAAITNPSIESNVVANNAGAAMAVVSTDGGGGITWTSGTMKANSFGALEDETAAANDADFELYVNNTDGTLTDFVIGSSTEPEKNYFNNLPHIGIKLVDVAVAAFASGVLTDIAGNNNWADDTDATNNFVEQWLLGSLTYSVNSIAAPAADPVTGVGLSDSSTNNPDAFSAVLSWTNAGQTGMKIEQDAGCDSSYDSTVYDNSAANETSPLTITGLSANTCYAYRISSYNADAVLNTSTVATSSQVTTPLSAASPVTSVALANASTASALQLALSWSDASQTGMKIEQDAGCDSSYDSTVYDNSVANETSPLTIAGLSANTCYKYKISSYNGDGVLNTVESVTSSEVTTPPAAPSGFSVGTSGLNMNVAWDAVAEAVSYAIYLTGSSTVFTTVTSPSYTYTASSAGNASLYVRTVNANGTSVSSSEVGAILSASTTSSGGGAGGGGSPSSSTTTPTPTTTASPVTTVPSVEAGTPLPIAPVPSVEVGTPLPIAPVPSVEAGTPLPIAPEPVVITGDDLKELDKLIDSYIALEKTSKDEVKSESVENVVEDVNPVEIEVLGKAISKGFTKLDTAEKKEVKDVVKVVVGDSVKKEIKKVVQTQVQSQTQSQSQPQANSGSVNSGAGGSVTLRLSKDRKVQVKTDEELDTILNEVSDAIAEGKNINLNDDGFENDGLQLLVTGDLFNEDVNNDGTKDVKQYSFGLDPKKEAVLPQKTQTVFTSKKDSPARVGKKPPVKFLGQPGDKGVAVAILAKSKGQTADGGFSVPKYLYSSVLAEVTEQDQIFLGEYELDKDGMGMIVPTKDLPEGTYYVVAQGENGLSEKLSEIVVDYDEELDSPELEWVADESSTIITDFILSSALDKEVEEKEKYLSGAAEPGTVVYVTWKSLIVSSIVMADASSGEFEVKVPKDLPEGDHEVIVYAFDPEKNLIGNISSLLFRK